MFTQQITQDAYPEREEKKREKEYAKLNYEEGLSASNIRCARARDSCLKIFV